MELLFVFLSFWTNLIEDPVLLIGLIVGILEIVGRAIPNPKWNGPIGYIVEALNFLSKYLNREKAY